MLGLDRGHRYSLVLEPFIFVSLTRLTMIKVSYLESDYMDNVSCMAVYVVVYVVATMFVW